MFMGIFAPFILSLSGRYNRENLQESVLRHISKCFRLPPYHIEEKLVSDLLFYFHLLPLLPSIPHSNLGIRHCSAMDSTVPVTTQQTYLLLLPPLASCCLKHSPDPVKSCLISLRQHNNSPGKKVGKHFRSDLGGHSECGCRRQQLTCTALTQDCLHNTDPASSCAHSS